MVLIDKKRHIYSEYSTRVLHGIRVAIGVVLGLAITGVISVIGYLLVICGQKKTANRIVTLWSRMVTWVITDVIGERVVIERTVRELDPDRPIVIYGEHPKYHEAAPFMREMVNIFGDRMMIPIARIQNGFLAPAVRTMNAIIIDRDKGDEAIESIRAGIEQYAEEGVCFVIFPTGTRGSKNSRAKARRYFRRQKPSERPVDMETIHQITEVTDVPKWRGFETLLDCLEGVDVQWVRVSIATLNGAENLKEYITRPPSGIMMAFDLVDRPPSSKEEMIREFADVIAEYKKETYL
jgi:hypothetical protein